MNSRAGHGGRSGRRFVAMSAEAMDGALAEDPVCSGLRSGVSSCRAASLAVALDTKRRVENPTYRLTLEDFANRQLQDLASLRMWN
jgi:hypothetical protein